MDDVQEAAQLEANLTALPATPTEEEIVQATKGFRGSSVSVAMYKLLQAAGGGGGGATPTLAEVLEAGNDAELAGIINSGNISMGDSDLDTEGGHLTSGGNDIDSGGGNVNSGGGDLNSGGGDLISGDGDLNLGAGLVKSDLVLAVGKVLDLTDSTGLNLKQATTTFRNTDQEVPAVATAQDVVDALVNLGLITQATP